MDLEFSDEQAALRDNVRAVITRVCPPSVVRAVFEGQPASPAIWITMVDLDWPGLAIAEEYGGLGSTFVELAIVAEELGRVTVPSPFLATSTQFTIAIAELGDEHARGRFLAPVARGKSTGTLAYAEHGRWTPDAVKTTAVQDGDRWRLDGAKHAVMDGATADEIVVIARGADGLGAFVVARNDIEVTPRPVLDPTTPIADLTLAGVEVPPDRVLAAPGSASVEDALERAVQQATVALAIATTATCRMIFETTLAYTKVREQYGRPIGSFQALQHRLADMYLAVERATALCYYAALAISEDAADRGTLSSGAKVGAGDCQRLVVEEGLQLHGGIGYMWESDLHFALKRAKAGNALFGDAVAHRAQIARQLGLTA
jgi:alkylation response protein AidB-like acyl-CoA dehydrogenase